MGKILLIDDSPTDRALTKKILDSKKHSVVELGDSQHIIEVIVQEKPDLILLDIIMPGINGYEVCRELKDIEETRNTPVIFISCKTQKSDIYWGKLQGADDYLTKPFQPAELLRIVDKHLGKNEDIAVNE